MWEGYVRGNLFWCYLKWNNTRLKTRVHHGEYPQIAKVKVKVLPIQATKALRVGRGIALPYLRLRHWRWGWWVSTTPRPLYPRERPVTHCTGGWVVPRAGLDGCGKSLPTGFRSPDRLARSESLYRLSYPGPTFINSLCNYYQFLDVLFVVSFAEILYMSTVNVFP